MSLTQKTMFTIQNYIGEVDKVTLIVAEHTK